MKHVPFLMVEEYDDMSDLSETENFDLFAPDEESPFTELSKPSEADGIEAKARELLELEASKAAKRAADKEELDKIVAREFLHLFRLGGWYRRLPRVDPKSVKPPNKGSARPSDIHPVTWSGCGQAAQEREKRCREAEERGEEPPAIPEVIQEKLPEGCREQIIKAQESIRSNGSTSRKS